jgi:S-methylmethionine-dependent homocysteine/selenocysteine methylase
MGSELERRGLELDLPLWSARALVEAPELVAAIHRENVAAGADILTANTFRTTRRALDESGNADRARELTHLAVRIAREAVLEASRPVLVAGSVAPLFDCYRPDLVPEDASRLGREHAILVSELASAGVDLLLLETFGTRREALASAREARASGLPFVASIVTDGGGRLLSGESLDETAEALWREGALAVGVNCVSSRKIGADLALLSAAARGRAFGGYANILSEEDSPRQYARSAGEWLELGARIVGGCCGTRPAHIAAIRALLSAA